MEPATFHLVAQSVNQMCHRVLLALTVTKLHFALQCIVIIIVINSDYFQSVYRLVSSMDKW
jgi:hypothetical protein